MTTLFEENEEDHKAGKQQQQTCNNFRVHKGGQVGNGQWKWWRFIFLQKFHFPRRSHFFSNGTQAKTSERWSEESNGIVAGKLWIFIISGARGVTRNVVERSITYLVHNNKLAINMFNSQWWFVEHDLQNLLLKRFLGSKIRRRRYIEAWTNTECEVLHNHHRVACVQQQSVIGLAGAVFAQFSMLILMVDKKWWLPVGGEKSRRIITLSYILCH